MYRSDTPQNIPSWVAFNIYFLSFVDLSGLMVIIWSFYYMFHSRVRINKRILKIAVKVRAVKVKAGVNIKLCEMYFLGVI